MRETRLIMGMPVTTEIADPGASAKDIEDVFAYFVHVDETFSTYKEGSEMSRVNRGELAEKEWSEEMRLIFKLAEETRRETEGYFDIRKPDGTQDPSGIVKGWAIRNAARILDERGYRDFYVDAGSDVEVRGRSGSGEKWKVGIRNPFDTKEIVKVLLLEDRGIATSGTYERGAHIYNPLSPEEPVLGIASMTVIGPDVYEADRFATAAFAMGAKGISFIENLPGFEGYLIDAEKKATMTSGFSAYAA